MDAQHSSSRCASLQREGIRGLISLRITICAARGSRCVAYFIWRLVGLPSSIGPCFDFPWCPLNSRSPNRTGPLPRQVRSLCPERGPHEGRATDIDSLYCGVNTLWRVRNPMRSHRYCRSQLYQMEIAWMRLDLRNGNAR
jgi:hypothetical protein